MPYRRGAHTLSGNVTQEGTTATFYFDGIEVASMENTVLPSDLGATLYNYIGRPCYGPDVYMVDTKLADFRIYDRAITATEAITLAGSTAPDDYPASLLTERDALDLGDLSAVTSAISLPVTGATDTDVVIDWTSSNTLYVDSAGNVTQPKDLDVNIKLTATLSKNGYTLSKEFTATILASEGFSDVMVLNWLFDPAYVDAETGVVIDQAEKNFEGMMMNAAKTRKIGNETSGEFYTLDLGDQDGYFDMGADVGTIITSLSDYMISVYFLIEEDNTTQGQNGNFIYNFSNSDDIIADMNGIMFCGLNQFDHHIGPKYYAEENQSIGAGTAPTKGTWHHLALIRRRGLLLNCT